MTEEAVSSKRLGAEIRKKMENFEKSQTGVKGPFRVRAYRIADPGDLVDLGETSLTLSMNDLKQDLEKHGEDILALTANIDQSAAGFGGEPQFRQWMLKREEAYHKPLYYYQFYNFPR